MFGWFKGWFTPGPPTPCPYCTNPDRDSVFDDWKGCAWKNPDPGNGSDPPCVCDSYPSNRQLGRLGMHN